MLKLILTIIALILAQPMQVQSFSETLSHLDEHDDHEHTNTQDHDHDVEHSHGDGTPAHSHAKDLAGILLPAALNSSHSEFDIPVNSSLSEKPFAISSIQGRVVHLLLFRPPISA
ncbi:MAG: hypothetical protein EOP09_02690 [Proteobacteria bacterium]|nr:MAG: hypothetical protein EOP09_02690 [Pseudomonadota bacterium]